MAGMLWIDRCDKCGHDGLCRYQDDLSVFHNKLGQMMNVTKECSHFNVKVSCPDYYEKTYTVRKGEKK